MFNAPLERRMGVIRRNHATSPSVGDDGRMLARGPEHEEQRLKELPIADSRGI